MTNLHFSPPFAGQCSFAKYPTVDVHSYEPSPAVGIIGVPYDMGSTNMPGSRLGPRAIRQASMQFAHTDSESLLGYAKERTFFDIERGVTFNNSIGCMDLGDIEVFAGNPEQTFKAVRATISLLRSKKILPICLGGDHAITAPILESLSDVDGITVLHFDAHMDYWDATANSPYDHSCCMWLAARMGHVKRIVQLGIRGLNHSRAMLQAAALNKVEVHTARAMAEDMARVLQDLRLEGNVYLSVDADFFDPSIAPGTGTREIGGGSYRDFSAVLDVFRASNAALIGADVVEVNPLLDAAGITSCLASRLVMDIAGLVADKGIRLPDVGV